MTTFLRVLLSTNSPTSSPPSFDSVRSLSPSEIEGDHTRKLTSPSVAVLPSASSIGVVQMEGGCIVSATESTTTTVTLTSGGKKKQRVIAPSPSLRSRVVTPPRPSHMPDHSRQPPRGVVVEDESLTTTTAHTNEIDMANHATTLQPRPSSKRSHKSQHASSSTATTNLDVTTPTDSRSHSSDPSPSFHSHHQSKPIASASSKPLSREALRKANHSLIERRRREKMNKAFSDLRGMVPGLAPEEAGAKGEFKLEVLERTVEHMRGLKGLLRASGFEETEDGEMIRLESVAAGMVTDEEMSGANEKRRTEMDVDTMLVDEDGRVEQKMNQTKGTVCTRCTRNLEQHADVGRKRKRSRPNASLRADDMSETELIEDEESNPGSDAAPTEDELSAPAGSFFPMTDSLDRDLELAPDLRKRFGGILSPTNISPRSRSPLPRSDKKLLIGSPGRHSIRADSEATEADDSLPPPGTIHPSFAYDPNTVLATLRSRDATSSSPATTYVESSPNTFPFSRFFHPNQQPIGSSATSAEHLAHRAMSQTACSENSGYRNPNIYLPPPLPSVSPVSPFFRPDLSSKPPPEPSPLLPPLAGPEVLFDGMLPPAVATCNVGSGNSGYLFSQYHRRDSLLALHQHSWSGSNESQKGDQDRDCRSRGSRGNNKSSSPTSSQVSKEEEAAANVLLALSSPEVMTPWQPPQNSTTQDGRLEQWSLDSAHTYTGPGDLGDDGMATTTAMMMMSPAMSDMQLQRLPESSSASPNHKSPLGLNGSTIAYTSPNPWNANSKSNSTSNSGNEDDNMLSSQSKSAKTARDILDMRIGTGYQGVSLRFG